MTDVYEHLNQLNLNSDDSNSDADNDGLSNATVNRVTWRGEEFIITRGGKPVAALSPLPSSVRVGDLGKVLAALPSIVQGWLQIPLPERLPIVSESMQQSKNLRDNLGIKG